MLFDHDERGSALPLHRKYTPRNLSEIVAQDGVVRRLRLWLKAPESCALIFSGPSGVGKTATANCLAAELGIDVDIGELAGLFSIPSGRMLGEHVEEAMAKLRFRPLMSRTGWRVLVANECDRMTQSAENIWLDRLESLPPQVVVIFTTNEPEKLTDRFRTRCEFFAFEERTEVLKPAIQKLCARIWREELGNEIPPAFGVNIGMPSLRGSDGMHASIRAALQQLSPLIREARERVIAAKSA